MITEEKKVVGPLAFLRREIGNDIEVHRFYLGKGIANAREELTEAEERLELLEIIFPPMLSDFDSMVAMTTTERRVYVTMVRRYMTFPDFDYAWLEM
jgi:hypothetical protein